MVVIVPEGGMAHFSLLRTGPADSTATVMYRFAYGGASPGDLIPLSNDSILIFNAEERMKNISFMVEDDDIPETDELFYIILFNATGMSLSRLYEFLLEIAFKTSFVSEYSPVYYSG